MPTWPITGCSTGFGRALALAVLARGRNAAITARNPADIADIAAGNGARCLPLALDMRNPAEIAETAKQAEARFGAIDVLVNNAGYGYRAATLRSAPARTASDDFGERRLPVMDNRRNETGDGRGGGPPASPLA